MTYLFTSTRTFFKDAAEGKPLFYPDSVISVPPRHIGIAQGRTHDNIMAIRVERGPSIGVAMIGRVVENTVGFSYRDQSPRVLVAQITDHPQAAIETCKSYFGNRARDDRKVYIVHDGTDPEMLKSVRDAFKGTGFKILMSSGAEKNWGVDLETGKMSALNPEAPVYSPTLHQEVAIRYCIDGITYMTGPLEILFDLSTERLSSFQESFELKNWSGREVGQPLQFNH